MVNQKQIDDAAIMWNKTKDPKYKDEWYRLIKRYYGRTSTLFDDVNSVVGRHIK